MAIVLSGSRMRQSVDDETMSLVRTGDCVCAVSANQGAVTCTAVLLYSDFEKTGIDGGAHRKGDSPYAHKAQCMHPRATSRSLRTGRHLVDTGPRALQTCAGPAFFVRISAAWRIMHRWTSRQTPASHNCSRRAQEGWLRRGPPASWTLAWAPSGTLGIHPWPCAAHRCASRRG